MKTNVFIFCLFYICLFCVSCGINLNNAISANKDLVAEKDGRCYADCEVEQSDSIYKEFIIYTGDEELEFVDVENINIEIEPERNAWVKKRVEKNCLSNNPDDCAIWCKTIKPAKTVQLKILKDTSQTKNYRIEKIGFYNKNASIYKKELKIQVICENEIDEDFIGKLQDALREKEYYLFPNTYELDMNTMNALTMFQLNNHLKMCGLTIESIQALGLPK